MDSWWILCAIDQVKWIFFKYGAYSFPNSLLHFITWLHHGHIPLLLECSMARLGWKPKCSGTNQRFFRPSGKVSLLSPSRPKLSFYKLINLPWPCRLFFHIFSFCFLAPPLARWFFHLFPALTCCLRLVFPPRYCHSPKKHSSQPRKRPRVCRGSPLRCGAEVPVPNSSRICWGKKSSASPHTCVSVTFVTVSVPSV